MRGSRRDTATKWTYWIRDARARIRKSSTILIRTLKVIYLNGFPIASIYAYTYTYTLWICSFCLLHVLACQFSRSLFNLHLLCAAPAPTCNHRPFLAPHNLLPVVLRCKSHFHFPLVPWLRVLTYCHFMPFNAHNICCLAPVLSIKLPIYVLCNLSRKNLSKNTFIKLEST